MTDLSAIRARLEAGYPGEEWEVVVFGDISDLLSLVDEQKGEIKQLRAENDAWAEEIVALREDADEQAAEIGRLQNIMSEARKVLVSPDCIQWGKDEAAKILQSGEEPQ